MNNPKYKITMRDLETRGGIAKLERDGHTKESIMKTMYKHTTGASQHEREKIVSKLYDRGETC